MTMGFAAPAMAQNNQAIIDQATEIIKSKPADLDNQLKPIYKKNLEVLVGIGRAFFEEKDTANARIYVERAFEVNSQYCPAYLLRGDMKAFAGDGGGAVGDYNQAIYLDPKNPDAYFKYAVAYRKINPSLAIQTLEKLRTERPDINVDAMIGRVYYSNHEFEKATETYKKVGVANLEDRDLTSYTMAYYLGGKYKESLDVAVEALNKSPKNTVFNRLAFFNNTELGNYDEALRYADILFHLSDTTKYSYFDYTYYGNALLGAKKNEEAISMFTNALDQEFDSPDKRAGVIKQLSDAHRKIGQYPQAIERYDEYLKTVSKASATDYTTQARLHMQYASDLEGEARTAELDKADQIYEDMSKRYKGIDDYITYQRAQVNLYKDPESKDALAKPFYEQLIEMILAKENKNATDNKRLIESYHYLMSYSFINLDDKDKAKEYANKILEIDPNYDKAKEILNLK